MKSLKIKPVEMTPAVMRSLEDDGLILRLTPGRHTVNGLSPGQTRGTVLYQSRDEYGPHRLLTVTSGRTAFSNFGSHPDNEEILFIGDPAARPLYLMLSRLKHDVLVQRIADGSVSEKDFVCLKVKFNDPEVSFFSLLADVPHDDAVCAGETGAAPSFYVTECSRMGVRFLDAALNFTVELEY